MDALMDKYRQDVLGGINLYCAGIPPTPDPTQPAELDDEFIIVPKSMPDPPQQCAVGHYAICPCTAHKEAFRGLAQM